MLDVRARFGDIRQPIGPSQPPSNVGFEGDRSDGRRIVLPARPEKESRDPL